MSLTPPKFIPELWSQKIADAYARSQTATLLHHCEGIGREIFGNSQTCVCCSHLQWSMFE
jgi:hypothetical protein